MSCSACAHVKTIMTVKLTFSCRFFDTSYSSSSMIHSSSPSLPVASTIITGFPQSRTSDVKDQRNRTYHMYLPSKKKLMPNKDFRIVCHMPLGLFRMHFSFHLSSKLVFRESQKCWAPDRRDLWRTSSSNAYFLGFELLKEWRLCNDSGHPYNKIFVCFV